MYVSCMQVKSHEMMRKLMIDTRVPFLSAHNLRTRPCSMCEGLVPRLECSLLFTFTADLARCKPKPLHMHMNTIIVLLDSSLRPAKHICHTTKLMGHRSSNFSNSCKGMVANSLFCSCICIPLLADNKPLNL